MKKLVILTLLVCAMAPAWAQKYIAESSKIVFFSKAPLEDIRAVNEKGRSVLDAGTGKVAFSIPVNAFQFKKSLMQEHFNEKYLETEKFPKSTFSATLESYEHGNSYDEITARGSLEIHGVKRDVEISGTLKQDGDRIMVHAVFPVRLEDYKIKIPSLMWQNIAEVVEVTIDFEYKPYEN